MISVEGVFSLLPIFVKDLEIIFCLTLKFCFVNIPVNKRSSKTIVILDQRNNFLFWGIRVMFPYVHWWGL